MDISITNTGGADYDVVPQAPSQGFLSARVKFNFGGNIFILDDPGPGLQFVDTGVAWTVGQYVNLTIDINPNANTIDDLREIWPRLSGDEKKLFDVIARSYLAALMPDFR